YWPTGLQRTVALSAFVAMFESLGYKLSESEGVESNLVKIAIYAADDGRPTHAARQLSSGRWSSKLGQLEDIEHDSLATLEGQAYGSVAHIMKRQLPESC